MNVSIRRNDRSKLQANAELLKRDRDRSESVAGLHDRERELASGEEACLFAVDRNQVGLGKYLQKILGLQSLNHSAKIDVRTEQEQIQDVIQSLAACSGDCAVRRPCLGQGLRAETAKLSGCAGADKIPRARRNKVHSQLREGSAIDFRELDLEQDFLGAHGPESQNIHHFRRVSIREVSGPLGDIFSGDV